MKIKLQRYDIDCDGFNEPCDDGTYVLYEDIEALLGIVEEITYWPDKLRSTDIQIVIDQFNEEIERINDEQ